MNPAQSLSKKCLKDIVRIYLNLEFIGKYLQNAKVKILIQRFKVGKFPDV